MALAVQGGVHEPDFRCLAASPGAQRTFRVLRAACGLLISDAAAVRNRDRAHSPASVHPLLPIPVGRGQLGLDAISFLTPPVDPTTSSEFVFFQQSEDRQKEGKAEQVTIDNAYRSWTAPQRAPEPA